MSRLFLATAVVLAGFAGTPARADGPLREGEHGFYCATHDGDARLFHKGDFYFCGHDDRLPGTVGFAVIGEPHERLVAAIVRFARVLRSRTGIEVTASRRPQVLFILPQRAGSRQAPNTPQDQEAAFTEALSRAEIEIPATAFQRVGRHIDLTATPTTLAGLDTLSVKGKPFFVVQTLSPDDPTSTYGRAVSEAITSYLAIDAPEVVPEKTSHDVYDARRLGTWLDVGPP